MGLTGRDSSSNFVMLTSSSSSKNNKKSLSNHRNASIRLRIRELGPVCESRKKAAQFCFKSEEEGEVDDGDFDTRFGEEGGFDFDDDKCMWLSSGTISPSSCFDDQRLAILLDLSFVGKDITFFDGSKVNPIEEACLVLERTSLDAEKILQENLKEEEEEIVSWLLSSISNDPTDSERNGFWDYAKWISDTESELDSIQSDFPSPSYKSNWGSEVLSSSSSASSFSEVLIHEKSQSLSSEDVDSAAIAADEPLFWPSDGKSDWGSELKWDFFIMSPRKHKHQDGTPLESIKLSLGNRKMDFVGRVKTMPSRFGKLPKIFAKVVPLPLDVKDDVVEPTGEEVLSEKSLGKYANFVDEDFASNEEEVPIETLLGLDEFDGHEGIESEFNKDDFSLDESV